MFEISMLCIKLLWLSNLLLSNVASHTWLNHAMQFFRRSVIENDPCIPLFYSTKSKAYRNRIMNNKWLLVLIVILYIYPRLHWVCAGVQFTAAAGRCHEHNASQTPVLLSVAVEKKHLKFKFKHYFWKFFLRLKYKFCFDHSDPDVIRKSRFCINIPEVLISIPESVGQAQCL